jgi:aubergine-like protein
MGKIVMTTYNDRTSIHRIDDINFDKTAMSTFHLRTENRDVTYKEYYRTRHNIHIHFEDLPLLVSRPT